MSISTSNIASDIASNGSGYTTNFNTNLYASMDYVDVDKTHGLYELKLVNGNSIIKEFSWSSIQEIKEVSNGTKRHIEVTFVNDTTKFEIDCNLRMFMSLIGKEYKSWSENIMEQSVKTGISQN